MTKKQKIAKLFLQKGTVTMNELNRISYRYGDVIHQLRKPDSFGKRWVIMSVCKSRSYWEYVLLKVPTKKQLKLLGI